MRKAARCPTERKRSTSRHFLGHGGSLSSFPLNCAQPTKRGLLAKVAKIYNPLGLVSSTTLCGELLYGKTCDLKIALDKEIPEQLSRKLTLWEEEMP